MHNDVRREAAISGICVMVGVTCLLLKLYLPVVIASVGLGLMLGSMLLEAIDHHL